jgi:hypothetical protein
MHIVDYIVIGMLIACMIAAGVMALHRAPDRQTKAVESARAHRMID